MCTVPGHMSPLEFVLNCQSSRAWAECVGDQLPRREANMFFLCWEWNSWQCGMSPSHDRLMLYDAILIPRLLPGFNIALKKRRSLVKLITRVVEPSWLLKSQFHSCHLCDKFYQASSFFLCNVEKLGGTWVWGYYDVCTGSIWHTVRGPWLGWCPWPLSV